MRTMPAVQMPLRLRPGELTKKGKALLPVLQAMRDWGLAWVPGTRMALES